MIIHPRLFLKRKNFAEFDEFSSDIVSALTGNINFPVTTPTVLDVGMKSDEYHKSVNAASGGNAQQKQNRNQLRDELHLMITNLANDVAARSNNDLAIFLTSGFDYRRPATSAGDPAAAQNFRFALNENEGELVTRHLKAANAVMYELWIGTTPVPPATGGPATTDATWRKEAETTATTYVVTGLTSGTRYYGYVISKGRKNKRSAPSNIAQKICP